MARSGASSSSRARSGWVMRPAALMLGARVKPEGPGADGPRLQAGGGAQGGDPRAGVLAHRAQPAGDAAAVVAHQGHRVGDRGEGHQVDRLVRVGGQPAPVRPGGQRPHQHVDHARGGRQVVRRPAQGRVGDDPGRAVAARQVVVEGHRVHAELHGARQGRDRRGAAVHAHQDPRALLGEGLDRRDRDAVALVEPARQERDDVAAAPAQRADQDRRRADPVAVVVAVHRDPLPGAPGPGRGGRRPRRCRPGPPPARAARPRT